MTNALALLIAAIATLGSATLAGAGAPTDQVREYTTAVQRVLDDPVLKAPEKRQERRTAVRKIASEVFDVAETARRALGPHWQQRTPAEREEFTGLFADLLERTYISRIDLYGGERVQYTGEQIDGDRALVRAKVLTSKGSEISIEVRMLKNGERWLIYDIAIENVSLIANYRVQFNQIIRKSSYGELVNRLKSNRDEFLDEGTPSRARKTSG
jgi:phospholipid transport system substrate-binding protein